MARDQEREKEYGVREERKRERRERIQRDQIPNYFKLSQIANILLD